MEDNRIIEFFNKMGMFDEKLYARMMKCAVLIDGNKRSSLGLYGIFYRGNYLTKVVLPKIKSIKDEIIWVHEYTHLLLWNQDNSNTDEIIPNIMEAHFINMYALEKEELINQTMFEIEDSKCNEHTLAKKIKLSIIK